MRDGKCSSLSFASSFVNWARYIKKPTTSIKNKPEREREDAKRREKDISSFEYASGEL